ncbi:MAG TPA: helix-turn-helix domain-containing protein [Methanomicrobiales archaeon]|nr:helix-turn-helix domain-containing protein [Methanomicrobiales archaeon]
MAEDSARLCICPLEGVIDTISKKWALLIIHVLGNGQRLRFNGLMRELSGISPKTLADTLAALQGEGFVGREAFAEIPPRVEYFLTGEGKELWEAILPLLDWTMKRENLSPHDCPPGCCQKRPGHHPRKRKPASPVSRG